MKIDILSCLEGARAARGITVIIDVFRAFTVECFAYARGAERIFALGDLDAAYAMGREHPDYMLIGERGGVKCEGFACGNSPSDVSRLDLTGRTLVHTTSAGTQGLAAAGQADEILAGCLANAAATAEYIRRASPDVVSLVGMGLGGKAESEEDMLCARYIRALILGEKPDITGEAEALRYTSGAKFFDAAKQSVFPQADFPLCVGADRFPFVLRAERQDGIFDMRMIPVKAESE